MASAGRTNSGTRMTQQTAYRLSISGHVQGVGFRQALRVRALELGLRGWVRNRTDGTVEALVEGAEPGARRLIEWARHGPAGATVSDVVANACGAESTPAQGFEVRPTR